MQLEKFERDGLELVINLLNGEVFSSHLGIVRMVEAPETTLRDFANSRKMGTFKAKIPTNKGMRMARLYNEDEIYLFFEEFKPSLLKQCSKCGLRVYLHHLAGFQVTSTALSQVSPFEQQILGMFENLSTQIHQQSNQINEMRTEMQNQNQRITLMLPSHEMMQEIKPALLLNDGTVLVVMKGISQNLKDFPDQKYSDIRYFLQGRNCGLGERISIGQTVSGCFKGCIGQELPTKYGYKRGNKLYPECAKPIFELVLKGMGK